MVLLPLSGYNTEKKACIERYIAKESEKLILVLLEEVILSPLKMVYVRIVDNYMKLDNRDTSVFKLFN